MRTTEKMMIAAMMKRATQTKDQGEQKGKGGGEMEREQEVEGAEAGQRDCIGDMDGCVGVIIVMGI